MKNRLHINPWLSGIKMDFVREARTVCGTGVDLGLKGQSRRPMKDTDVVS